MMRDDFRKLRSLPPRPTLQVLESLRSASAAELKGAAENAPRVTLHLASGREVYGTVIGLVETRYGSDAVLLQTGGDRRYDLGSDATYVALASVEAVTVHEATAWVDLLAGGKLVTVDSPPTKLGARRTIDQDRQRVSKVAGKELNWSVPLDALDGEPLRITAALSTLLATILEGFGKDNLGKQALTNIRGVTIEHGETLSVKLDNGVLHVHGSEQSADALRTAVEAAF